jgi:hypothetical protein
MFNYYFDADREGHEDTVLLFDAIRAGKHKAYTSDYAVLEMQNASEPKRASMLRLIEEYGIIRLEANDEALRLADLYVESGAIPKRFRFDSAHIAISSIHRLDCILSYNFHHINRLKTKILAEKINRAEGYGIVTICTAKEVLDNELYNEG